jgi:DNA-binding XRE family transcriptional regulator
MSSPTINTNHILIQNVFNKISPKILSPDKNSNFCSNNPKESGLILLKLRNLHNYSVEDMATKLNISREEYRNLEKGTTSPSKEVSNLLYQIFEIVS